MSCPTYHRLISQWLDGEMTGADRAVVETHLATCERCRKLLLSWRLQGAYLRNFLRRHSLGEEFIRKVNAARGQRALAASAEERGWSGNDLFGWLQAAAGLILMVLLLIHLIPSADGQYLARVVREGEKLETRSSEGFTWSHTSIGAMLRRGDWVRNYQPGDPQLLLNDSSRITFGRGALARLGETLESGPDQITLVQGSILSEVQPDARGVRINLPRGDVIGLGGRFSTSVQHVVLPRIEFAADASMVLSGSVEAVSEVRVHEGAVRVSAGSFRREVAAGKAVSLAPSLVTQKDDSGSISVRTSLSIDGNPASESKLISSLAETGDGLRVRMEARQLPLGRLIEWTTDSLVRGGERIRVTGWMEYAPGLRRDVLVQAIGESLGVPMSIRRDIVPREVVTLPDASDVVSTGAGPSEFTLRKSASGSVSFDFRSVPAGEVFRALRGETAALPDLASESSALPVTLHAGSLKVEDVSSWLGNRLKWTVRDSRHLAEIVDIASTSPGELGSGSGGSSDLKGKAATRSADSAADPDGEVLGAKGGARRAAVSPSPSFFQIPGILANHVSFVMAVPNPAAVQPPYVDLKVQVGNNGVTATARISRKNAQHLDQVTTQTKSGQQSRHLVWPALAGAAALLTDGYTLHNPFGVAAHTLWRGYDSTGHLMAWYEIELAPGETMTVSPMRDLVAALDEGGHWETVCDTPLAGGTGGETPEFVGFYAESLPAFWEFDAAAISGMGGDSRLWMINPGDNDARAILAVVDESRTVFSQEILIAPHAGLFWAAEALLPSYPELARPRPASSILIQLTEGSLVAGTRTSRSKESRDLVFESTPNR